MLLPYLIVIGLSLDVRPQTYIIRDLKYDLACFDAMVKKELQENNQNSPAEEYQVTLWITPLWIVDSTDEGAW